MSDPNQLDKPGIRKMTRSILSDHDGPEDVRYKDSEPLGDGSCPDCELSGMELEPASGGAVVNTRYKNKSHKQGHPHEHGHSDRAVVRSHEELSQHTQRLFHGSKGSGSGGGHGEY